MKNFNKIIIMFLLLTFAACNNTQEKNIVKTVYITSNPMRDSAYTGTREFLNRLKLEALNYLDGEEVEINDIFGGFEVKNDENIFSITAKKEGSDKLIISSLSVEAKNEKTESSVIMTFHSGKNIDIETNSTSVSKENFLFSSMYRIIDGEFDFF